MEKKEIEGKTYYSFSRKEKAQLKGFLDQLQSGNITEEALKELQGGIGGGAVLATLSRVTEE